MNPKQFLLIAGVAFLLFSVLGLVGIFGPTSEESILGAWWWFDSAEAWTYLVLGAAALASAYLLPMAWRKYFTLLLGVVAVLAGLYGALVSGTLFGASLQVPADTILLGIVGLWALWAGMRREVIGTSQVMGSSMPM